MTRSRSWPTFEGESRRTDELSGMPKDGARQELTDDVLSVHPTLEDPHRCCCLVLLFRVEPGAREDSIHFSFSPWAGGFALKRSLLLGSFLLHRRQRPALPVMYCVQHQHQQHERFTRRGRTVTLCFFSRSVSCQVSATHEHPRQINPSTNRLPVACVRNPPPRPPPSPSSVSPPIRLLGTPNEDVWPNVTDLQDWNPGFPTWKRLNLTHRSQGLDKFGLDLLEVRSRCFPFC